MSYDEKRIIEISLLFLAICNIIISKEINNRFLQVYYSLPRQSQWALIYIFFAGLLSSILAPSVNYALIEFSLFCLLFFFCLFTAAYVQKHEVTLISILLIGIFAGAFFYEITFFTSYIGSFIQANPLVFPEPFSGFSSVRFFNQYQIWTMPFFSLALFLYGKRFPPTLRGLTHIITASWWVLLFASESRGAMSALALSFVITLIAFRKHARPLLMHQAYSAAFGLGFYFLFFLYIPESAQGIDLENIFHTSGRTQLWMSAWEMIKNNPWLGVGPMHFAYYPNPASLAHPHNSFMQLAAEWGLPSSLLLLFLFIWGSTAWVRKFKIQATETHTDHTKNQLWITLFYSFIAGSLYSLVSGVIVMPLSQMMLAIVLGIMLGMYFQKANNPQITYRKRIIFSSMAASILLLAIVEYAPLILDKFEIDPTSPQPAALIVGPRFWQEGGIPH